MREFAVSVLLVAGIFLAIACAESWYALGVGALLILAAVVLVNFEEIRNVVK